MTRSIIEEIEDDLMEGQDENYEDAEEDEEEDAWRTGFEEEYEKAEKEE